MNGHHVCSRRSLLKAMGVGPALLPMLEGETAAAACNGVAAPKRVFIIVWPNGMFALNGGSWATTGDNFVLPSHMASLEPHRKDLILLDGLDYKFLRDSPNPNGGETTGHACFQGMLTGALYQSFGSSIASNIAGGPSIDQYIGNALKAQGYPGLISLNLQVYSQSTARLSWKAAGQPVIPNYDPFKVFAMLFAVPSPMPTVDRTLAMRKSVLDYVAKDLTRFVSKVGGTADRANVDSHLQSVRQIEERLGQQITNMGAGACQPPDLGTPLTTIDLWNTKNFEAITKMQIDLTVAAFAADATRVSVLQLGDQSNANIVLTSLGFVAGAQTGNAGVDNGHHAIAHANAADLTKIDTWLMSQVAYAISRLKDVSNGATTMFDNTALLAMSNMRTGIGEFLGVPAILAGSCGGTFKTGRSLKLVSTPNNGVLIALANAAGVPTTTFGEPSYGGELAALRG